MRDKGVEHREESREQRGKKREENKRNSCKIFHPTYDMQKHLDLDNSSHIVWRK